MVERPQTLTRPRFPRPAAPPSPGRLRSRWSRPRRPGGRTRSGLRRFGAATLLGLVLFAASPPATTSAATPLAPTTAPTGGSLEAAANRAGDTGRKIGLSLIGLALSVAAVILVFKRDFKEAVGVVAIGIVAILLVSPAGLSVLQDTVSMLFGG